MLIGIRFFSSQFVWLLCFGLCLPISSSANEYDYNGFGSKYSGHDFGQGVFSNGSSASAQRASDAFDRGRAAERIGDSYGGLGDQLGRDRSNLQGRLDREPLRRNQILASEYKPPVEFREAVRILGVKTNADLESSGRSLQQSLYQRAVDLQSIARKNYQEAQQADAAAKNLQGLERKSAAYQGKMRTLDPSYRSPDPLSALARSPASNWLKVSSNSSIQTPGTRIAKEKVPLPEEVDSALARPSGAGNFVSSDERELPIGKMAAPSTAKEAQPKTGGEEVPAVPGIDALEGLKQFRAILAEDSVRAGGAVAGLPAPKGEPKIIFDQENSVSEMPVEELPDWLTNQIQASLKTPPTENATLFLRIKHCLLRAQLTERVRRQPSLH